MGKQNGLRVISFDSEYSVCCWSEKTRYGFRHLATLTKSGLDVCRDKACYYNRTWECYEYHSVIHGVLKKYFGDEGAKKYIAVADGKPDPSLESFKTVSAVAMLGEIFGTTQKEKNDWKKRMLKHLPGLDFPENFDGLPEAEKSARLDKVIKVLKGK